MGETCGTEKNCGLEKTHVIFRFWASELLQDSQGKVLSVGLLL